MKDFTNKVVVVTGAASGVALALAEEMRDEVHCHCDLVPSYAVS